MSPNTAGMRNRVAGLLCGFALVLATTASGAEGEKPGTLTVATDVVIVRPVSLVSMVVGSALFVISLPVTAITKSTAEALVTRPAYQTFKRPLGDMDAMAD